MNAPILNSANEAANDLRRKAQDTCRKWNQKDLPDSTVSIAYRIDGQIARIEKIRIEAGDDELGDSARSIIASYMREFGPAILNALIAQCSHDYPISNLDPRGQVSIYMTRERVPLISHANGEIFADIDDKPEPPLDFPGDDE